MSCDFRYCIFESDCCEEFARQECDALLCVDCYEEKRGRQKNDWFAVIYRAVVRISSQNFIASEFSHGLSLSIARR